MVVVGGMVVEMNVDSLSLNVVGINRSKKTFPNLRSDCLKSCTSSQRLHLWGSCANPFDDVSLPYDSPQRRGSPVGPPLQPITSAELPNATPVAGRDKYC